MPPLRFLLFVALVAPLFSCTVGPDYHRPAAPLPESYKEQGPWREAAPSDHLDRGAWWQVYGDPALDQFENRARAANQNLLVALSRVDQARAVLGISRSDLLPRLDLLGAAGRNRTAGDFAAGGEGQTQSFYDLPLALDYEIDLWGRVRRSVEAADAELAASVADFQSVLLALQAEVARTYFAIRTLDAEQVMLQRAIGLRRENLRLVRSRLAGGEISRLDVTRAETELAIAEADAVSLARDRSALEHGLAVLLGEPASTFSLPAQPLDLRPPAIAAGLPATLLERRPDVAAAERRMAAANATIGVAKTAFFPDIRLSGSGGFASTSLGDLFTWDNRTWGLGPVLSLPLFTGGRNRANLERTRAAWDGAAAGYRQQVLQAVREVEDGLSGLRLLAEQAVFQGRAVAAGREAAELSRKRYRAGMVSYLEVVDAERTVLQAERQAVRLLGQQMETSVFLIRALGGGWEQEG